MSLLCLPASLPELVLNANKAAETSLQMRKPAQKAE